MTPIICKNDLKSVLNKIQECLEKGRTIKGLRLVDCCEDQAVILIDDQPISQEKADVWWEGYSSALELS